MVAGLGLFFNCYLSTFPHTLPLLEKEVICQQVLSKVVVFCPYRRQPGILVSNYHTRVESSANGMTNCAAVVPNSWKMPLSFSRPDSVFFWGLSLIPQEHLPDFYLIWASSPEMPLTTLWLNIF